MVEYAKDADNEPQATGDKQRTWAYLRANEACKRVDRLGVELRAQVVELERQLAAVRCRCDELERANEGRAATNGRR